MIGHFITQRGDAIYQGNLEDDLTWTATARFTHAGKTDPDPDLAAKLNKGFGVDQFPTGPQYGRPGYAALQAAAAANQGTVFIEPDDTPDDPLAVY